jgi:hypothetical protein
MLSVFAKLPWYIYTIMAEKPEIENFSDSTGEVSESLSEGHTNSEKPAKKIIDRLIIFLLVVALGAGAYTYFAKQAGQMTMTQLGVVSLGMSPDEVKQAAGEPNEDLPAEDGSLRYLYESESTGYEYIVLFKDETNSGLKVDLICTNVDTHKLFERGVGDSEGSIGESVVDTTCVTASGKVTFGEE